MGHATASGRDLAPLEWGRRTGEFEFAPYVSKDGKFRVQDMRDQPVVEEYNELLRHNWDNNETHRAFLAYCKEHGISLTGANWVLVNNQTGKPIKFPFKTAKAAKEYAETVRRRR